MYVSATTRPGKNKQNRKFEIFGKLVLVYLFLETISLYFFFSPTERTCLELIFFVADSIRRLNGKRENFSLFSTSY